MTRIQVLASVLVLATGCGGHGTSSRDATPSSSANHDGDPTARSDGGISDIAGTTPGDGSADATPVSDSWSGVDANSPTDGRRSDALPTIDVALPFGLELAVSPAGSDTAPGTVARPFLTLEKARDTLRTFKKNGGLPKGGVVVWLRAGSYPRAASFELAAEDSGTADSPVVFRAWPGEVARLTGGKELSAKDFSPLPNTSPAYARLDATAQGKVLVADLGKLGVTDYGTLRPRGMGTSATAALELFVDGQRMPLGRWPDPGDATALKQGFVRVAKAIDKASFTYAGDRPTRWASASDIWLHGFFANAWADFHMPVQGVDPATQTITLAGDAKPYGIASTGIYYAYNLLEEITQPGEWYLDHTAGLVYLWPPANFANADIVVSLIEKPLVRLAGTSFVRFADLLFEYSRVSLSTIEGGADNAFVGCTFRGAGTRGAQITGTRNGLANCQVYETGEGGVSLDGGDRPTLTKAGNYVDNCLIHDFSRWTWTYTPGVYLSGCGQIVQRSTIHDAPHSAILFVGNEHQINRNDIHHVLTYSSDAGAIYTGRDWGARGNIIEHNFIHDIATQQAGYGAFGVYLDDCVSGITVRGNIFYRVATAGILHGGGRDDLMNNNLFARNGRALSSDRRCATWPAGSGINNTPGSSWNLIEKLVAVGYRSPTWTAAYPACAALPNTFATLQAEPHWREPEGSTFSRNVGFANNAANADPGKATSYYADVSANVDNVDVHFVDEPKGNLALQPDSPVFAVPGWQPIPWEEIGYKP